MLLYPKLQINPLSAPCSFYHLLGPRRQQRPDQIYQISSDGPLCDGKGNRFKLRCARSIGIAFFGFGCHQDVSWRRLDIRWDGSPPPSDEDWEREGAHGSRKPPTYIVQEPSTLSLSCPGHCKLLEWQRIQLKALGWQAGQL